MEMKKLTNSIIYNGKEIPILVDENNWEYIIFEDQKIYSTLIRYLVGEKLGCNHCLCGKECINKLYYICYLGIPTDAWNMEHCFEKEL